MDTTGTPKIVLYSIWRCPLIQRLSNVLPSDESECPQSRGILYSVYFFQRSSTVYAFCTVLSTCQQRVESDYIPLGRDDLIIPLMYPTIRWRLSSTSSWEWAKINGCAPLCQISGGTRFLSSYCSWWQCNPNSYYTVHLLKVAYYSHKVDWRSAIGS